MQKVGRNDPCPCGSGKKFKNCHMDAESSKGGKSKALIIGLLFLLFIAIGAIGFYMNSKNDPADNSNQFQPGPPPGPAPPGKVWSYEHGHWHDA